MIAGSNAYIEISPKIDISLIGEMIFSFYAGSTGALILKKRYPADTVEANGRLYLGFTQEDTVRLYNGSGNGEVELETQVNFADSASVRQLPIKHLKIRRTRGAELVAGNAPRYDMPCEVVDIKTGDIVLLRGEKGDTGDKGEKGDPGDNYVLTESDKVEIAQRAANPLAALVTLAADSWVDDSDTFANIKKMRIGYCTTEDTATDKHVYVAGIGSELVPTYEWVTYSYAFTLSEDAPAFAPLFRGGTRVEHVHPYDFMDVKVYAASDSTKTNLLSDDIEVQNYKGNRTDVKHAIAISDGVKYMHVFRQPANHVTVIAKGTAALLAGDYVLEFKLRLTPWKYTYVAPVPEAHSEYVITVAPLADSVAAYNGSDIYCAAFGSQQLIFVADSIPTSDIGVGCTVIKAAGAQGIIIQPPRAVLPAAEDVTEGF